MESLTAISIIASLGFFINFIGKSVGESLYKLVKESCPLDERLSMFRLGLKLRYLYIIPITALCLTFFFNNNFLVIFYIGYLSGFLITNQIEDIKFHYRKLENENFTS